DYALIPNFQTTSPREARTENWPPLLDDKVIKKVSATGDVELRFQWGDYAVKVRLNDYLDIVCPHYPLGEVASQDAERYVLYMVERGDYEACRPQSYEQLRWECDHPFAPHAPEKFSEKFQRFTPFTLGKEFRPGESYYYISKPLHHHGQECLKLRVDVVVNDGSEEARVGPGRGTKTGAGGAHTPSNRLPA
ncbi:hypothetical protein P4O66_019695, partial [Electrophorus voltai]